MTESRRASRADCLVVLIILLLGAVAAIAYLRWWSLAIFGAVILAVWWWANSDIPDDPSYPETPVDPILVRMNNEQIGVLEQIRNTPENKRDGLWAYYKKLKEKEKQYRKSKGV